MAYEFKAVRRVEFSDTDMAGIMHFSNFFRFMETAEHGFFRSLGLSVIHDRSHPGIGWPRVRAECEYLARSISRTKSKSTSSFAEVKSKAIRYVFKFRKLNGEPSPEIARGSVTVVCVSHAPGVKMKACAIPPALAALIEPAPARTLAIAPPAVIPSQSGERGRLARTVRRLAEHPLPAPNSPPLLITPTPPGCPRIFSTPPIPSATLAPHQRLNAV